MGSSQRKKKEKKQDFQKTKLKVGKTKAKAGNFTDTSFKSKSIAMGQNNIYTSTPDEIQQFKHTLSLASSSKSDKQRQESLANLTTQLSADSPVNPVGTHTLLTKLLPLVSDSFTPARTQVLKLFRVLPEEQVKFDVEPAIMFIRAGMTHLSADISNDAMGFLDWLLEVAGEEVVACPGGWVKTLNTFCAMLGWTVTAGKDGWSAGHKGGATRGKAALNQTKTLDILTKFLRAGLEPPAKNAKPKQLALHEHLYRLVREPNAYAYLNLSGSRRDEDGEMYADRESRQRVFHRKFLQPITKGAGTLKSQGGTPGRAAAGLDHFLKEEGMADYEPMGATDTDDLLELW